MRTVKLLSWHEDLPAKTARLAKAKLPVDATPLVRTSAVVGELAALNPAALVLDLDRLPSNSREIALMLRASKSARHIPILLAGTLAAGPAGELPEKYARLRTELPDLPYAVWPKAAAALAKLLKEPKTAPHIVPAPRMYTATLAQKLGVFSTSAKADLKLRRVALVAAPDGFTELLGDLPETVSFGTRILDATDLAVCFIRSLDDLRAVLDMLTLHLPEKASVWIAYPKCAAHPHLDFNENDVRNPGLAAGLVDYKICSIDKTWSGIKFAWRK